MFSFLKLFENKEEESSYYLSVYDKVREGNSRIESVGKGRRRIILTVDGIWGKELEKSLKALVFLDVYRRLFYKKGYGPQVISIIYPPDSITRFLEIKDKLMLCFSPEKFYPGMLYRIPIKYVYDNFPMYYCERCGEFYFPEEVNETIQKGKVYYTVVKVRGYNLVVEASQEALLFPSTVIIQNKDLLIVSDSDRKYIIPESYREAGPFKKKEILGHAGAIQVVGIGEVGGMEVNIIFGEENGILLSSHEMVRIKRDVFYVARYGTFVKKEKEYRKYVGNLVKTLKKRGIVIHVDKKEVRVPLCPNCDKPVVPAFCKIHSFVISGKRVPSSFGERVSPYLLPIIPPLLCTNKKVKIFITALNNDIRLEYVLRNVNVEKVISIGTELYNLSGHPDRDRLRILDIKRDIINDVIAITNAACYCRNGSRNYTELDSLIVDYIRWIMQDKDITNIQSIINSLERALDVLKWYINVSWWRIAQRNRSIYDTVKKCFYEIVKYMSALLPFLSEYISMRLDISKEPTTSLRIRGSKRRRKTAPILEEIMMAERALEKEFDDRVFLGGLEIGVMKSISPKEKELIESIFPGCKITCIKYGRGIVCKPFRRITASKDDSRYVAGRIAYEIAKEAIRKNINKFSVNVYAKSNQLIKNIRNHIDLIMKLTGARDIEVKRKKIIRGNTIRVGEGEVVSVEVIPR